MDFKRENDHTWSIGSHSYIKYAAKRVSEIFKKPLGKKKTPTVKEFHPEMDTTPLCNAEETNYYQLIQGITHWIHTMGRVDISYVTNHMSAYNAAPRKVNFQHPEHTFSYLEEHKHKVIRTRGKTRPTWMKDLKNTPINIPGDMKENYKESFLEDLPNKPEEIQTEIEAIFSIDSSLASLLHNYKSVT